MLGAFCLHSAAHCMTARFKFQDSTAARGGPFPYHLSSVSFKDHSSHCKFRGPGTLLSGGQLSYTQGHLGAGVRHHTRLRLLAQDTLDWTGLDWGPAFPLYRLEKKAQRGRAAAGVLSLGTMLPGDRCACFLVWSPPSLLTKASGVRLGAPQEAG